MIRSASAFDPKAHWSKDVSRELAEEIQTRCDIDAVPVPEHIQDFVRSHWACDGSLAEAPRRGLAEDWKLARYGR